MYALYQTYGYSQGTIGRLFIAGFGSSMIFGTFAGALADRHGRKRAALAYVLLYSAACATKHIPDVRVLALGRLLCGVATSLLYSAFEAWVVSEHASRGFPAASLSTVFSQAALLGNGVMAILSGLVAHALVEGAGLGPVAPFDAAAAVLLVGGAIVATTWRENRGGDASARAHADKEVGLRAAPSPDSPAKVRATKEKEVARRADGTSAGPTVARIHVTDAFSSAAARDGAAASAAPPPRSASQGLLAAARLIASEPRVALLGAMQSLFEASMYTFVFLWTPALSPSGERVPHGMVFACFMASSAAGSALAGLALAEGPGRSRSIARLLRPESYMQVVFLIGAACLAVPTLFHGAGSVASTADESGKLTFAGRAQVVAFCVFEACVGAFWPSIATQRANVLPDDLRATVTNLFRVPLNAFVCLALANIDALSLPRAFGMCSTFLAGAAVCQRMLSRIAEHDELAGSHAFEGDDEKERVAA